ncbi:MAG: HAMP domain-containing sensor histidine kinase [Polyangiaceae bacterium]|jgi:signal transduction histidine kinase
MNQNAEPGAPIAASPPGDARHDLHAEVQRLRRAQRTAQRTIRELRAAVAARDEFIAIVSRELRNPTGAIVVSASHLIYKAGREPDLPAWLTPRLLTLERQTRSFVRRATTLMDVSRLASGNLRLDRDVVSLSDIVSDVARELATEADHAGCELRLSIEPDVVGTWDRVALEQITIDLMSNAIKYGADRPVETSVTSTGEDATIEVRDHGAGISEVDRCRIFEPFERAVVPRRSKPGFGLGLWITRQLVVAHRGEVAVQSQSGIGSVFTVSLPRAIQTRPR